MRRPDLYGASQKELVSSVFDSMQALQKASGVFSCLSAVEKG